MSCETKLIAGNLPAGCLNTAPGLTDLYLTRKKWLTGGAIPAREDYHADPATNAPMTISGDVTFDTATYPEAGWYYWPAQAQTLDLESTLEGPPGAKYRTTNLPFKIAGHAELVDQAAEWLDDKEDLIAVVLDKDNKRRLVGAPATPLRTETNTFKYGKAPGDESGFEIAFICDTHKQLWPYYTGALTPVILNT